MTVWRGRLEEQRRMNGNGGVMLDGRRPPGRLFYVLLSVLLWTAVSQAQTPAMTTISDVVYRADGTPAPSGLDTLGGMIATLRQRGVFNIIQDPNMKTA